ncbi:hypothetical protein CBL_20384 [Carabus blaptoides fortunei]
MTDIQWEEASSLEALLKFPYEVTKKFQASGLTPGSFIKKWKNVIFKLSQIGGILADVTSNFRGKSNLRDVAVRIKMLTDNDFKDISTSDSENDNYDSSSNSNGSNDFEKHLDNKDKSKRRRLIEETEQNINRKVTPTAKFNQEFMEAFKNIDKIDRISKLDVKSAIPKNPKIVEDVSSIVTALPPTQVSVELPLPSATAVRECIKVKDTTPQCITIPYQPWIPTFIQTLPSSKAYLLKPEIKWPN